MLSYVVREDHDAKTPSDHSIIPLGIIPLGYEHPKAKNYEKITRKKAITKRRKKFEEMIHKESW